MRTSLNSTGSAHTGPNVRPERLGSGVSSNMSSIRIGSQKWKTVRPEGFGAPPASILPPRETTVRRASSFSRTQGLGQDTNVAAPNEKLSSATEQQVQGQESGAQSQSTAQAERPHASATSQTHRQPVWFLEEDDY